MLERRADVQGLRAVAVLAVVAFHAGLPLSGGFVGVDVFFVVSGFVITRSLSAELGETGRLRLGAFYVRRFKRLTPALALTVAVTAVLSSLLLSPFGPQQVTEATGLGALGLVANYVISQVTGGYFAPAAEVNPLLHTWSLSVEEQFYLVFPAVLLLAWIVGRRIGRPRLVCLLAVGALTLVSFAMIRGSALGLIAPGSWLLGFYSPLIRAWEFGLGALVALAPGVWSRVVATRPAATVCGLAGALLIAASVVVINGDTAFPGKATLLPTFGAALVIIAGYGSGSAITTVLASRPLVAIGDWSYSIYLWHWPLIVIGTTLWPTTRYVGLVAASVSLLPALASYRWWEQPIRRAAMGRRRLATVAAAVLLVPSVLAGCAWAAADSYWKPAFETGRISAAHPAGSGSQRPREPLNGCDAPTLRRFIGTNGSCGQSGRASDPRIALLGDSHAEHLYSGLHDELPDVNIALLSLRSPSMFATRPQLSQALDHLSSLRSLRVVIISRYWRRTGLTPDDRQTLSLSVQQLRRAGKTVLVADDVPDFPFDAFQCRYRIAPLVSAPRCAESRSTFLGERERYLRNIEDVLKSYPGARLLRTSTAFCNRKTCSMLQRGVVRYGDDNHLNEAGSRFEARHLLTSGGPLSRVLTDP